MPGIDPRTKKLNQQKEKGRIAPPLLDLS